MNDDQPRRGDRVRFSVEGTVHRSTGAVISLSHEERVPLYDFYWPLCPGMTVEILERAKPPEPPGLGAVVRATFLSGPPDLWVRVDHGDRGHPVIRRAPGLPPDLRRAGPRLGRQPHPTEAHVIRDPHPTLFDPEGAA